MKKISNGTIKGMLFFYIHLVTEVVTFFIITRFMSLPQAAAISIVYDFLAFVPQGIFGFVFDEKLRYPGIALGVLLMMISLGLLYTSVHFYVIVVLISMASCLIHITAAEHTLRDGKGKMTPVSLFVAGGSFGVITGKILANRNVPIYVIMLVGLTILLTLIYLKKHPLDLYKNCTEYDFADPKLHPAVVVVLATIVVAVRSFIGYGIPTSWNKELYQAILLFVFMGTGKALGGILIDKIGIRWVCLISTIGSLPFLIWGDNIMILSIIGVMFFSMTMSITLALIVSVMKKHPGIAFGMTTIGLFAGTFPLTLFAMDNKTVNIILIVILTIVSLILLLVITRKRKKESDTSLARECLKDNN